MKTSDFYYDLPEELIAQKPIEPRENSRLMVCHRDRGIIEDKHFFELPSYLHPGDVLVVNRTKVIPARLLGHKEGSDVPVEFLLLKRLEKDCWEALVKPGRRIKPGTVCSFGNGRLRGEVMEILPDSGGRVIQFHYEGVFESVLEELGQMPLPPYIYEKLEDKNRYQTVYAQEQGSAAAPTAGLHFTEELLKKIEEKGVTVVSVLLHVGLGTFRPVKEENIEDHMMHSEYYQITAQTANAINQARANHHRCICVGTTSLRTLESVVDEKGIIHPGEGETDIFITPGKKILSADGLITNFHLPESTLLMLISAFWDRKKVLQAYRHGVEEKYRFFSFGDAMFLC
ncbi:MAG: tRNA preQ1(34) S-adenosylmethionine ribosyltransferase-isomerase QueA [Clostridiales bacterium]|nr:tRNA preQ1(34) S-adenosylmethionine ribosyltransferase-isomerase QueA [Clostridiales bacterium]